MPTFYYTVKSLEGETRTGVQEAQTKEEVARTLRKEGFLVTRLTTRNPLQRRTITVPFLDVVFGVSTQEKVDFTKNLALMLKSGITINEALGLLVEQTESRKFREILFQIKSKIEKGTPLSEAFSSAEQGTGMYPAGQVFGKVFISAMKAGEASGTLDENLKFAAEWFERSNDLQREISSATLYPKIVLGSTILLAVGLAVFILPKLIPLFQGLRLELPLITKIVLKFAEAARKFWAPAILTIFAAGILFRLIGKVRIVRRILDGLYIRAPFFGRIATLYQLALTTQIFSTLFRSGLSIVQALEIASETSTNTRYREAIARMKEKVEKGIPVSLAMKDFPKLFPKNTINIIATGEKSGALDNSFEYLADFYSKEISSKVKRLPIVIEPLLLIGIGVAVGFVALAIILPIYELTKGLQG